MKNRTTLALTLLLVGASLPGQAIAADLVLYDKLDFAATVAKAFEAKTGLTVDVVEPGSTGELLGKISAEGDNPQFDIVWVDGSAVMERMLEDKVLQPIPRRRLCRYKVQRSRQVAEAGQPCLPADRRQHDRDRGRHQEGRQGGYAEVVGRP